MENVQCLVNTTRAQQPEQRVHQTVTLLRIHGGDPCLDGLVHELGIRRDGLHRHKVRPNDLPGIGVVLQYAHLIALDNGVGFLMLQQHPDHRGLGHVGLDPRNHGEISGVAHEIIGEAGAVIVVNLQNPLLNVRRASCGGENCQISALGVAAQTQRHHVLRRHLPDVVLRQQLGGDGLLKGHVEIFLPAHQRPVRSPEGHEGRVVGKQKCHGRKLCLLLRDELIPVQHHFAPAEPRRLGGSAEHHRVVFCPDAAFIVVQRQEIRRGIPQRDWLIGRLRRLTDEGDIREGTEDQPVHRVQGVLREGQVAAPFQIIKNSCHSSHLLKSF